jgi:glutathione peroxidase
MRPVLLALLLIGIAFAPAVRAQEAGNAYQFSFTAIDGAPMPLAEFKGKAVLLVNTASQCGFTPQYTQLEEVWKQYRDRGLVVVGVPSNDFGGQEPGSAAEIKRFCEGNYDVDFPLTTKNVVKGQEAHPFYRWAAATLGADAAPKWNFHKYLIDPNGKLVAWFPSKIKPDAPDVTKAIEAALPPKA